MNQSMISMLLSNTDQMGLLLWVKTECVIVNDNSSKNLLSVLNDVQVFGGGAHSPQFSLSDRENSEEFPFFLFFFFLLK